MSLKLSKEEALSGLINALDHAIAKGAFTRHQVVQLNDLIKLFTDPQPEAQEELALEDMVQTNGVPQDPSKPRP